MTVTVYTGKGFTLPWTPRQALGEETEQAFTEMMALGQSLGKLPL